MSDPFRDSPFALLHDYLSCDRRFDVELEKIQSLQAQIDECRARQKAYVTEQQRITARLAPAFARVGVVKYRDGWDDYAVSHDGECDFLSFDKLHDASDLDAGCLGDLAAADRAVVKAFEADDPNDETGEHAPVEGDAALAVVNQAAS